MRIPVLPPSGSALTARQAARELGVSHTTCLRLIYTGALRARVVGRQYVVERTDLEAFLGARPELQKPAA